MADINGSELCIKAVRLLKQELANGRRTLINSDAWIVNKTNMQQQLDYLDDHLPENIRLAAKIVEEEETIRTETEQKRSQILNDAQTQAQNMVNDVSAKAQDMMNQASYEANALMEKAQNEAKACMDAARAEASRMLEDAEKKAKQLVEEENIVRRARVESEELREKAQQDAATLHKNTLDYIDSMLADLDRNMSNMINSVRMERSEIKNHR